MADTSTARVAGQSANVATSKHDTSKRERLDSPTGAEEERPDARTLTARQIED
jgi:hypothetical protein